MKKGFAFLMYVTAVFFGAWSWLAEQNAKGAAWMRDEALRRGDQSIGFKSE